MSDTLAICLIIISSLVLIGWVLWQWFKDGADMEPDGRREYKGEKILDRKGGYSKATGVPGSYFFRSTQRKRRKKARRG